MATSTADPLHQHPFRQDVVFRVDEQALSSGPDCLPAVSTIGHADFVGHGQLERPSKWQYFNATKTARDTPAIRSRDATSRVPQVSRKVERAQPVPATPATEDSARLGHAARGQTPAQTTREWRNTESEKKALCPLTCLTTLSPIPRTATYQHAKTGSSVSSSFILCWSPRYQRYLCTCSCRSSLCSMSTHSTRHILPFPIPSAFLSCLRRLSNVVTFWEGEGEALFHHCLL